MQRRRMLGALPGLVAATRVFAQDAASAAAPGRRHVVMSLVSDKLSFVEKTGSTSDPTQNRAHTAEVPLPGAPYETAALQAMAGALTAADPAAHLSFIAGSAPEFYADQDDWFDGDAVKLPARLQKAVAGEAADVFLLLTKWRGEAAISDGRTRVGSGKIGGLGFYRFARREGQSRDDTEVHGYIAPFVYTRLSLIDLKTFRPVSTHIIQEARPCPGTLTPELQISTLLDLLGTSLREAVPLVLRGA